MKVYQYTNLLSESVEDRQVHILVEIGNYESIALIYLITYHSENGVIEEGWYTASHLIGQHSS
jgi:hypothetical protein